MNADMIMRYSVDLNAPLVPRMANTLFVSGDNMANTIEAVLAKDGKALDASGYTCVLKMNRPDGEVPEMAGKVDGNVLTVTMTSDFYAVPGHYTAKLKLINAQTGERKTVLVLYGEILDDGGMPTIIPGNKLPEDIEAMLAMMEELREATADARNAAQEANEAADGVDEKVAEANAELTGKVGQLSEDIGAVKKTVTPKVIMIEPEGFDWKDSPIHAKIYTDYRGNVKVDYDVAKNAVVGKTYYVDRVNGSDSNDGLTVQTPLKTMTAAYNKSDIAVMKLTNGVYDMSRTLRGIIIKKDLSIIGMGDEVYITSHSGSVFAKTDGYEAVYQSTRGLITGVVDMSVTDAYGDWMQYEQVSTIAHVEEVAGSYAHIGGVLYVHTVDNRVPDDDLLLFAGGSNIAMSGGHTLYLENLKVIEGNNPLLVTDDGDGSHPKVYCKNCTFAYSVYQSGDAVSLQGVEIAVFQNCIVKHAKKDGFNYHALNDAVPKAIEIGCTAYGCGYTADNDDQGSTMHDGGKIIRINGNYFGNRSGNIADESEGTQSWNIGCVSHDSNGGSGGYNTNFFCYPGVDMWLDNCVGFGSEINCYASEGGKIYTRFNRFSGAVSYPTQTERIVEY